MKLRHIWIELLMFMSKVCDILEKYGTITDVAEDETTDATATDSDTAESSDSTETTADGETQTAN